MDTPDARLLTAIHEAGHAVMSEHVKVRFKKIWMNDDVNAYTDTEDHDGSPGAFASATRVAVAGFAAVGVMRGGEAENQSRTTDDHEEDGSDLMLAIGNAQKAGVADEDLDEYLERIDGEVREFFQQQPAGDAVQLIAQVLWEPATRYISGDEIRMLIEKTAPSPETPDGPEPRPEALSSDGCG